MLDGVDLEVEEGSNMSYVVSTVQSPMGIIVNKTNWSLKILNV